MDVSEAIIQILSTSGVTTAFGISGSHLLPFLNRLRASSIDYFSAKHECAAAFMALHYARLAQRPALLLATAGPGAANLVGGVAELFKASIPAFIITPTVSRKVFGMRAYQEDSGFGGSYSIVRLMAEVTRRSVFADDPASVPRLARELLTAANQPPYGPVHMAIPADFFPVLIGDSWGTKCEGEDTRKEDALPEIKLSTACTLILEAEFPILLVGSRCVYPQLSEPLQSLVDGYGMTFVVTHGSKGLLNEWQSRFGGVIDYFGHRSAEALLRQSDLVLTVNFDFSEAETLKYDPDLFAKAKLVVLDYPGATTTDPYTPDLAIKGDVRRILQAICEHVGKSGKSAALSEVPKHGFETWNSAQITDMKRDTEPMEPPFIFAELSNALSEETTVIADIGAASFSSLRHLTVLQNGYHSSAGNYSMGQAVAGCIGAKIARRDRRIVCICGDGALMMYASELLTAYNYKLGITWIVFCDGLLNMVNINQELAYGDLGFCVELGSPDLESLSRAYGAHCIRATTKEQLTSALKAAERLNGENRSVIIALSYRHQQHLPTKARFVKAMQDMGQTSGISPTPHLMRALAKVIRERV